MAKKIAAKATTKRAKVKVKTIPWDSVRLLKTKDDIAGYLEAVLEDGDPALITHALGVIARSKGMTEIGRATGLGRESLYKALSAQGNPEFATRRVSTGGSSGSGSAARRAASAARARSLTCASAASRSRARGLRSQLPKRVMRRRTTGRR